MQVKANKIVAMVGWSLLAVFLLLLGIFAAFEHNAAGAGVAIVLWVASCALIVRRAVPILASLIAGEE